MKHQMLASAAFLLVSSIPAIAAAEPITCYRDRDYIDCREFGRFRYGGNYGDPNYNRPNNNYYNDINDLYRQILGRNADRAGLDNYSRNLNSGWSLTQVRRDLAYSSESANSINRVYLQVLGRNVDPGGLETQRSFLANGGSLDQLRRNLASSDEARNRRRY
ncbi:DUF4214 domain-containing protein [Pseudanabaena sp. PCC 6802]|uniref:DUF4214 domain-containing protein n=1 Tax=Pseudanabaena sp. PCC 6802 TaxID=118173 RepID=UPI000347FC9D|nr:DUF4214 domain-containing protein [Pseudanabaena sp. PCC 6802]